MTDFKAPDQDVNRAIRSWLHENRHEDASRLAGVVLDQVDTIPQRRAGWLAWRTPPMNKFLTIGVGAAAVVVLALFIGSRLVGPSGGVGAPGGQATPTPEVTPTPAASSIQPTPTAQAGLPEGPFELAWNDMPDGAPRITVTIPAPGWNNPGNGALEKGEEMDNLPEAALLPFSDPAGSPFYVYADPCRMESTKPETPATTVEEIVAALVAQASRDASEPEDVTVGGYPGQVITLHVPGDINAGACEGGRFASFGIGQDELARYHQGPGQIDELWIVDVEGSVVILDTMYRPNTPAELIDELRAIAASATFELP